MLPRFCQGIDEANKRCVVLCCVSVGRKGSERGALDDEDGVMYCGIIAGYDVLH